MLNKLIAVVLFAGTYALVIAPASATTDAPVELNIVCNDGTVSPTCTTCHRGCCSKHGGCR